MGTDFGVPQISSIPSVITHSLLTPYPFSFSTSMASIVSSTSDLKSAALLEQMKLHLATDAGKDIINKIGLVYQLNIAPKKIGYNEEIYVVDLKKGEVTKENLHKAFGSPWSDEPAKGDQEFNVPQCYYAKQPPSLYQGYFSKFQLDTLFYIFYSMPKDEAHLYAANELSAPVICWYNRGWFYHREHHSWLMRVTNMEPLVKTNAYERGSYICFDPNTWETIRKVSGSSVIGCYIVPSHVVSSVLRRLHFAHACQFLLDYSSPND